MRRVFQAEHILQFPRDPQGLKPWRRPFPTKIPLHAGQPVILTTDNAFTGSEYACSNGRGLWALRGARSRDLGIFGRKSIRDRSTRGAHRTAEVELALCGHPKCITPSGSPVVRSPRSRSKNFAISHATLLNTIAPIIPRWGCNRSGAAETRRVCVASDVGCGAGASRRLSGRGPGGSAPGRRCKPPLD